MRRNHVNGEIQKAVHGFNANDQKALDKKLCDLDGTPNKARLERTRFWAFLSLWHAPLLWIAACRSMPAWETPKPI